MHPGHLWLLIWWDKRHFSYLHLTRLQPWYFPLNCNDILQLLLMCHLFTPVMHWKQKMFTQGATHSWELLRKQVLSTQGVSETGQSAIMPWRLITHGDHKAYILPALPNQTQMVTIQSDFSRQLQPGDLKLRFPFHRGCNICIWLEGNAHSY